MLLAVRLEVAAVQYRNLLPGGLNRMVQNKPGIGGSYDAASIVCY